MRNPCGTRVNRGSWYLGPCLLRFGHKGAHNPYPTTPDNESSWWKADAVSLARDKCAICRPLPTFVVQRAIDKQMHAH